MDHLGSHKGKAVRQLIRSAVPSSSFCRIFSRSEPNRTGFAKLKHLLRKAAARTLDSICAAIGEILEHLDPKSAPTNFRNLGYAPTKIIML
jgi:hypothetical protein